MTKLITSMVNTGHRAGLVAVGGVYVLVFGTLLVQTDFLPYVFDNNETFSAWFHAYNLLNFDFGKSFGLTDEAFSFGAAAHPYVYTHGLNFPRFASVLMHLLGAKTPESQVLFSTATIGAIGIWFAVLNGTLLMLKPSRRRRLAGITVDAARTESF